MSDISSDMISSSQLSVSSPDGEHIATLKGSSLEIRTSSTLHLLRTIRVPTTGNSQFLCLKWAPTTKGCGISVRFLLSDQDNTLVWDLQDHLWSATINNGTGGMGKIANVEFGSDDTEVLVFSQFGARVAIWSLWTGKYIEIKDPKFATRGYGQSRPGRAGIFAIITRPSTQDVLSLHVPGSYALLTSFTLPTVDAQGLRWSPDGRWLAVWDSSSYGYKVLIYTCDGNLFRMKHGDYFEDCFLGLGVKSIDWSPNGDFLVIGGYESSVTLLSTRTFSPAVYFSHSNTARLSHGTVWQEQTYGSERSYTRATQAVGLPPALSQNDTPLKVGVSILGFSADGSLLATKDDSTPTAVWIWDLSQMKCRAVLVQHAVVKRIKWHPTRPELLLVQCIQGENITYVWDGEQDEPKALNIADHSFSAKAEASWIHTPSDHKPTIMYGDTNGFVLAYPDGREETRQTRVRKSVIGGAFAEPTSDDESIFDIVDSGEDDTAINGTGFPAVNGYVGQNGAIDDTFHYKRGIGVL